jgi:hypothetical protein
VPENCCFSIFRKTKNLQKLVNKWRGGPKSINPLAFLIGGGAIPLAIGGVGDYYSLVAGFIGVGWPVTMAAAAAWSIGRQGTLLS